MSSPTVAKTKRLVTEGKQGASSWSSQKHDTAAVAAICQREKYELPDVG